MIHEDNQKPSKLQRLSLSNVNLGMDVVKTPAKTKLFLQHLRLIMNTDRAIGESYSDVFFFVVFLFCLLTNLYRNILRHSKRDSFRKTLRYVLFTHDLLFACFQFQISPDLEPEPCDSCFGWCSVPDQP